MSMVATLFLLAGQDQAAAEALAKTDLAKFDLAKLPRRSAGCAGTSPVASTDVVVCAGKKMDMPIDDARYRERPKQVAGADARVVAEQRVLPGGISGPALMFNLKWPF